MNARIIPEGVVTVTLEDAMIDLVCFEYALAHLADRRTAGKLKGYVEMVLDANPGLAALGPVLPLGTVILMPQFIIVNESATVRLWD